MKSREELKEILDYDADTGIFRWKKRRGSATPGQEAGWLNIDGYVKITINKSHHFAHRLAWLYVYEEWPEYTVDHIDGNKTNNRILNLRDIPHAVNVQNVHTARSDRLSGRLLGAYWNKANKRWVSQIRIQGRIKHLGYFDSEQDAHNAYVSAKRKHHEGCVI